MKKILSIFVIFVTTAFSQEAPQQFKEMFYISIGTEISMKKINDLCCYNRAFISTGMGIKTFICEEHAIDVCLTVYHDPLIIMNDFSVGYIYKPERLNGIYIGVSGYGRNELSVFYDKFYRGNARGIIGYQVPSNSNRSSFLEVGMDGIRNLTIRSGLLF